MLRWLLAGARGAMAQAAPRVDRAAAAWLAARESLDRPLVCALLEELAERVGAKVEITELP